MEKNWGDTPSATLNYMYHFLKCFLLSFKHYPRPSNKSKSLQEPMHGLHRSSEKHFLAINKLQQTYEHN